MQNLPVPVACTALLPIVLLLSIELAALATEMPAIKAATAVSVVKVFIFRLLGVNAADAACSDNERAGIMFRELARRRKKFWEMRR